MSIHLRDIETLLEAYTTAHQRGALQASGNLLPHLVRTLVKFVEERTGGASVTIDGDGIALNTAGSVTIKADEKTSETGETYNPLTLMEEFVFASSGEGRGSKVETLSEAEQPAAEPVSEETGADEPKADENPTEELAADDVAVDETTKPKRGARTKA